MSGGAVARRVNEILESMREFIDLIGEPRDSSLDPALACDFVAGNPQQVASPEYVQILKKWAQPEDKDWFGYKGAHPPAQEAAARSLSDELGIAFYPEDILLTRGAHGALGAAMAAVLDPGDEVIFVSPPWFFYEGMIVGAGAVPVKTKVYPPDWDLDLDSIEKAITLRTRMVLLNTPHNPTGKIFPAESLKALAGILEEASERNGRPIYILSDEAYSRILFDGNSMVTPASFYPRSLLVHTYSKSALAPGQRLGYLALPPDMPDREAVRMAIMAVGFATSNSLPDAIMQYGLAEIDALSIDLINLQSKRDRMMAALRGYGYEMFTPEATFYLLVKAPIDDDLAFCRRLRSENVFVLPGRAVEMPGWFRISLTATDDMVDRSLPVFERAFKDPAGS